MDHFENYEGDEAFWFVIYLRLGAIISKNPSLSAKNSDFKARLEQQEMEIEKEMERRLYGFLYQK